MKNYLVLRNEGLNAAEVLGNFKTREEALKLLNEYKSDFDSEDLIIDEEDLFVHISSHGENVVYQIVEIDVVK